MGIESLSPAFIDFEISAPFWMKAWFILLLFLIAAALVFSLVRYRIYILKRKHLMKQRLMSAENDRLELEKNVLELEMKALRLQMDPHFIFNALNTIKGYYAQDKVREANAFISKFAKLLRLTLNNTQKYIPLDEEIKILDFYLQLTKIRYDNIFDFNIIIDKNLDSQQTTIPPMLLQPMVENAIIHGLVPREKKGTIHISFESSNGHLVSKVIDNGIGREAAKKRVKHKIHISKATQITQERLAIIHNVKDTSTYFLINDLKRNDGSSNGTEVVIRTPLESHQYENHNN